MKKKLSVYLVVMSMLVVAPGLSLARWVPKSKKDKTGLPELQRVLVLDGSNVHNVGELQMHVGNWGNFGSWPGTANTFSEAPSAQWPAGSGVEYLFTSGLWVGALKNGVPAVSTAAFATEFRPTQEPEDIIYRSAEGAKGGNRLPSPDADDDKDGLVDEDWKNGHDDDLDGLIDEDFAAVSKQMFSCWYTDDQPNALQIFPTHNPLNLLVRQESYQWEEDRFDDFVGMEFRITNIGTAVLEDLYIGFFADGDAGPRERDNYWEDDATGRIFVPVLCTDLGPVQIDVAYTFDPDTDEGQTPGYFGLMFLGHTTDPTGETAPERVGISTYANFAGSQSFEEGGDPTNDFERYELLSQEVIERDALVPRDYRMLVSAGPFAELFPDTTLIFQVAFVIGRGPFGAIQNAASAQLTFNGAWFNLDGSKKTGVAGRETEVRGPAQDVSIDTCLAELSTPIPNVPRGTSLWINNDCANETLFRFACGYTDVDSALFRTGIDGKETQIPWIVGTAPPPPFMRIDDHGEGGVVVYFDNFSETVPDVKTQVFDFEGYRIWRADNWQRPIGSSSDNGPENDLWKLLAQIDVTNNFGDDTGVEVLRYDPLTHLLGAVKKRDLINFVKQYLTEFPGSEPPCPQGVTAEVCDTLTALAQWELGVDGGRQYYRFVDRSMHLGRPYFYAVTAMDHGVDERGRFFEGKVGDPSSNFVFVEPKTASQPAYSYEEGNIYVVPNPATKQSMEAWTLAPNNDDPTGIKVEFRNLPRSRGVIRVYTLAGDLVKELEFDGRGGVGTVKWDLVSRSAQDVTSGVYLYSVESEDANFDRFIGKFVVIR
ncbi:MAG: hypothetical protein ACE5EO_12005 [Candidatus Krumholzibacteriia bacterium]